MPAEINAILQQQGQLGQVREYQIINGKELRIIQGTGARQRVYLVHLLALADKSKLRFHITWGWFYLALASLIGLVVFLAAGSFINLGSDMIEFAIIAIFILGIVLGLILVIINFTRVRVFYSRNAGIPLFELQINKPDFRSYKAFMEQLKIYVDKTRSFFNLRTDQQIAGEMRMLRRLATEGVIAQRDYDRAKNRLFGITNRKSRAN